MNKIKIISLLLIGIVLFWSAVNPASNSNWLLENSPIFVVGVLFFVFKKYLKFSDISYLLIALYLFFPIVASHYGITGVPFGYDIGGWFGFERNMFDRLTHFAFGFLLFFPIYELVLSLKGKTEFWNYAIALQTIITGSVFYEIFEWLAAISVNPTLGTSFYGAQGDPFDTPEDIACAFLGAIISMTFIFLFKKIKNNKIIYE